MPGLKNAADDSVSASAERRSVKYRDESLDEAKTYEK
jgi:hypothetical protein